VVASRGAAIERDEKKTHKGRCPLCLDEEDVKHMLLDCLETINWRMNILSEKCPSMNKEVAYRKILG
jgi:hypothetical protein